MTDPTTTPSPDETRREAVLRAILGLTWPDGARDGMPTTKVESGEVWQSPQLAEAMRYARRYWQFGNEPESQATLHILRHALIAMRDDYENASRERDALAARLDRLRAEVAAGEASDGYHTHRELYEYRMLYNAHAARGWLAAGIPVVKSLHHSDGEPCFGGGWFIVTATLPTGQVSNHYRTEHLSLFADVPTVDLPPEYDGHTPAIVADRLRALLAEDESNSSLTLPRDRWLR